jgi:hypothetical protein
LIEGKAKREKRREKREKIRAKREKIREYLIYFYIDGRRA